MSFLDDLNTRINGAVQSIKAWPQYRKTAAAIILLGLVLLIIGIVWY